MIADPLRSRLLCSRLVSHQGVRLRPLAFPFTPPELLTQILIIYICTVRINKNVISPSAATAAAKTRPRDSMFVHPELYSYLTTQALLLLPLPLHF